MSAKNEKTSSVMGFVVSMLLHGIFFAGCFALDYTKTDAPSADQTEITKITDQAALDKSKS